MYERYRYLSQIKFDKWRVVTTPIAGIVAACFAFSELQNMCFIELRGLMLRKQRTPALFLVVEMQVEIFQKLSP